MGDYQVHYRRRVGAAEDGDREMEVVVDMNVVARKHPHAALHEYKVSPDGRLVAFTAQLGETEERALFLRSMETGDWIELALPPDETADMSGFRSFEWGGSSTELFVTVRDALHRPSRCYGCQVDTDVLFAAPFRANPSLAAHRERLLQAMGGGARASEVRRMRSRVRQQRQRKRRRESRSLADDLTLIGMCQGDEVTFESEQAMLLYEEGDPAWFLEVSRSKDYSHVYLLSVSKAGSEIRLFRDVSTPPRLFRKRRPGEQYFVEVGGQDCFAVVSHDDTPGTANFRIAHQRLPSQPASEGEPELCQQWHFLDTLTGEDAAERSLVQIEDVDLFHDHYVLFQLYAGLPRIRVASRSPGNKGNVDAVQDVSFAKAPQWLGRHQAGRISTRLIPALNMDYNASAFEFSIATPQRPVRRVRYDFATATLSALPDQQHHRNDVATVSQFAVPAKTMSACEWMNRPRTAPLASLAFQAGESQAAAAVEEEEEEECVGDAWVQKFRAWSTRETETQAGSHTSTGAVAPVPLTLVRPVTHALAAASPVALFVYGAYGTSLDTDCCPEHVALLERGWTLAFAHVRGGGELGKIWHNAGRFQRKHNSITDLVACAEFLRDLPASEGQPIVVAATSAGALTAAGALNERPDLFDAALLRYPFLDVATTLRMPWLPLTEHEYDEWGNARDAEVAAYLESYSPFHGLSAVPERLSMSTTTATFPPVLIRAGMRDERVGYWEALRYAARLRSVDPCADVFVHVAEDAGHFGTRSVPDLVSHTAEDWALVESLVASPL